MPQIWLTYDELAMMMDCDAATARASASAIPLDRRRSRDGHIRVKLNGALTDVFLDMLLRDRTDHRMDACIRELKAMGERMTHGPDAAPPAAAAG